MTRGAGVEVATEKEALDFAVFFLALVAATFSSSSSSLSSESAASLIKPSGVCVCVCNYLKKYELSYIL